MLKLKRPITIVYNKMIHTRYPTQPNRSQSSYHFTYCTYATWVKINWANLKDMAIIGLLLCYYTNFLKAQYSSVPNIKYLFVCSSIYIFLQKREKKKKWYFLTFEFLSIFVQCFLFSMFSIFIFQFFSQIFGYITMENDKIHIIKLQISDENNP